MMITSICLPDLYFAQWDYFVGVRYAKSNMG